MNILFKGRRTDSGEWVEGCLFVSQMSGCFILRSKIDITKKRDGSRTISDKLEQFDVDPATVEIVTPLYKAAPAMYEALKVIYATLSCLDDRTSFSLCKLAKDTLALAEGGE